VVAIGTRLARLRGGEGATAGISKERAERMTGWVRHLSGEFTGKFKKELVPFCWCWWMAAHSLA